MPAIPRILPAPTLLLCTLACTTAWRPVAPTGAPAGPRAVDPAAAQAPPTATTPAWPPAVVIDAEMAFGNFEHETDGSNLDGDDAAWVLRMRVEGFAESGFGGGVGMELLASDDGLFDDAGFNATEASVFDFYAHGAYRLSGEALSLPLRAGFVFRSYELADQEVTSDVSYDTFGIRFEVEPEVALVRSDALVWSLRARAGYTFGWTEVSTDPGTFEADADSDEVALEVGTRFAFDKVRVGIGYLYSEESVDPSDVVAGNQFFGVDARFRGIVLDFALAF